MAKSKKIVSLLLSLAVSSSVFSIGFPASAARSVKDVLNADNAELAVWVKADTGVQNGVWQDQSGKGNDLIAMGDTNSPDIIADGINGKPAVMLKNANDKKTFFAAKYGEEYTGDSTVFIVSKLNQYGNWVGLYSTGDGETPNQFGTYENIMMSYGKNETAYYKMNDEGTATTLSSRDRACAPTDNTIPLGNAMNYTYTITQNGDNVAPKYRYTDNAGVYQEGGWNRGTVAESSFLKHTGFVLGNRDQYKTENISDMVVAEAIVVLGTMTEEDITLVRNYLDAKYFGSGYDPFVKADYSVQKLPNQVDPLENEMPLLTDDSRLALWVDGDSFNAEAGKWYDKSAAKNDMTVYGNITSRTAADLKDNTVVHFPGTNDAAAAMKLPEVYSGDSMIYFVYKPYKVDSSEAPENYNLSYRGIFTTDYIPRGNDEMVGRYSGIDIHHGGDGVEIWTEIAGAENNPQNCDYSGNLKHAQSTFAWNAGRTDIAHKDGSSYLGYTKGFMDFEVETLIGDEKTVINYDFKDGEGSIPSTNTGTDETKRGINRSSSSSWDTTNGAAKADRHYGFTVGARWDKGGTALLMDVAEIIVIHGTLTSDEKKAMSEYINKKYYKDTSSIVVPEKMLAKNVTLSYYNEYGDKATEGVSEAYYFDVAGTLTNKYCADKTSADAIVALYSKGKLYSVDYVKVTDISEEGAPFTVYGIVLPEDKSDISVKIMGLSDLEGSDITPAMDAMKTNISVY